MLQSWGRSILRHCRSSNFVASAPCGSPRVKRQPGSIERRWRWAWANEAPASRRAKQTAVDFMGLSTGVQAVQGIENGECGGKGRRFRVRVHIDDHDRGLRLVVGGPEGEARYVRIPRLDERREVLLHRTGNRRVVRGPVVDVIGAEVAEGVLDLRRVYGALI